MGYLLKGVWVKSGNIESMSLDYLKRKLWNTNIYLRETYRNIQEYKNRSFLFCPKNLTINGLAREKKEMRILKKMRHIIKDEIRRRGGKN